MTNRRVVLVLMAAVLVIAAVAAPGSTFPVSAASAPDEPFWANDEARIRWLQHGIDGGGLAWDSVSFYEKQAETHTWGKKGWATWFQVPKLEVPNGWWARGFTIGIAARRKPQATERCKVRARIWYYRDGVSPRWTWKVAATQRMSTSRKDRLSRFRFLNRYDLKPTGSDRYWDSALLEVVTNGKCRNAIAVVYSIVAPENVIWPDVLEWLEGGRVGPTPIAPG